MKSVGFRFIASLFIGLLAAAPAMAEDPLGLTAQTSARTQVFEGLLGPAVVVGSCPSPASVPVGLTWDGSHLWVAEYFTRMAFRIDPSDCSVVSSFALPGTFPGGLAFDGTYLWHADSNSDTYYQIDPADGSVVSSFASPYVFPTGLAFHGGNIWGSDVGCLAAACPDNIYEVSGLGVLQNTFAPPGLFPTGLTSDGVNIWHSDNNSDLIYKIDPADFSVLDSFPSPGSFPNDLAWDGRYIWVAESTNERLFKIDVGMPDLPRSQGFWKHQCSENGFHHYSDAEMADLFNEVELQSSAFSECAEATCELLTTTGAKNDMRLKALIQLLATWLNVVSDRQPLETLIDLGDLTDAGTVGEAIDEVESAVCDPEANRSELETAKNIAESLIFLGDDFDIDSSADLVAVRSGSSGETTLALINLGPTPRSYDLTATGGWTVSLSPQRVTGLKPGGTALITVTTEAPMLSSSGDLSVVEVTAWDRDSKVNLQRALSLVFQVPGSGGGGGAKRVLKSE